MREKVVIFVCVALGMLGNAVAGVMIEWRSGDDGVVCHDGVTLLPVNSIVQLIWSPDPVLGGLNVNSPLAPTGNDVLLDTRGTSIPGTWASSIRDYDGGGTYIGGYVFQRVFDVTTGNTPGEGDYYGDGTYVCGPLIDAATIPPAVPDLSYLWSSTGSPFVVGTEIVIPEPGTLVFVLLGIGVMLWRMNNKTYQR